MVLQYNYTTADEYRVEISFLFSAHRSSCVGVTSVDTDVEAKTVVVEADPSVSPQFMLEKLQKVRRTFLRSWF
jgi:hypothetical protein